MAEFKKLTICGLLLPTCLVNGFEKKPILDLDEEGEVVLIVIVVLVFVAAGLFSLLYFCCKVMSSHQQTTDLTTGDEDGSHPLAATASAEATITGPVTVSFKKMITTSEGKAKREPAIFSTEELKRVQIFHKISELEEMTLYEQDQKWLEEVKSEGGLQWKVKIFLEFQNDLQGKKNVKRFLATYNHVIGGNNQCNSCRDRLHEKGEWYRCRDCVDVDFCAKCFGYGPTISAYGHVPDHESAKILVQEMCFICKAFISNTKLKCEDCHHVYFCLGCFKKGKHEEAHEDHPITRISSTSYIMMRPEDVPSETSPLLPPKEPKGECSTSRTYVPSGAACNVSLKGMPRGPPPPYDDVT